LFANIGAAMQCSSSRHKLLWPMQDAILRASGVRALLQ
jgi:hypothetical protein